MCSSMHDGHATCGHLPFDASFSNMIDTSHRHFLFAWKNIYQSFPFHVLLELNCDLVHILWQNMKKQERQHSITIS